jgi:hypothetical protein
MNKNKIEKVLREFKSGKLKSSSGKKVTNPKQALAIAISEAKRYNEYNKPLPIREAVFRYINLVGLDKFNEMEDELVVGVLDVMLFASGTFNGVITTEEDLKSMVSNALELNRVPIVKITHKDDVLRDFGLYSVGEVDINSLRVISGCIVGNLKLLKWVVEFIYKGYLRSVSAEVIHNLKVQSGKVYNRVLDAIAILGSEREAQWEKLKTYSENMYKKVNNYDKIEMYSLNEVFMEEENNVDNQAVPVMENEIEIEKESDSVIDINKMKEEIISELKNYIGELITNMMNNNDVSKESDSSDNKNNYNESISKLEREVFKLKEEKDDLENSIFLDNLIKSGKLSPANREKASDLLRATFKVSYSEGNNNLKEKIKSFLNSLENKVEYSEKEIADNNNIDVDLSDIYVGRDREAFIYEKINKEKAKKYSEEKGVSFEKAVEILFGQ